MLTHSTPSISPGAVSTWIGDIPHALRARVWSLPDQHSDRVAVLCARLAIELDLNVSEAASCGFLHDVGKIRIPADILNKPGPLSNEEYRMMQTHVMEGVWLIQEHWTDVPAQILQGVLDHHERLGGKGYPQQSAGPGALGAVVAVADVFDALTSRRPYRGAYSVREAVQLLQREALPRRVIRSLMDMMSTLQTDTSPEPVEAGSQVTTA